MGWVVDGKEKKVRWNGVALFKARGLAGQPVVT